MPSTPSSAEAAPSKGLPGVSGKGKVRTDITCTNCPKAFVAELDFDIDGEHVVECPHCGHEHCRVIKAGVITEERWSGRNGTIVRVSPRSVWKSSVLAAQTSTISAFIRDLWLNRSDRDATS